MNQDYQTAVATEFAKRAAGLRTNAIQPAISAFQAQYEGNVDDDGVLRIRKDGKTLYGASGPATVAEAVNTFLERNTFYAADGTSNSTTSNNGTRQAMTMNELSEAIQRSNDPQERHRLATRLRERIMNGEQ